MSIRLTTIAASLALITALPAMAGEPNPTLQPASTIDPGDSLICHTYYHEGTLIQRRDCRTQKQWDRIRIRQESSIAAFQLHALIQRN